MGRVIMAVTAVSLVAALVACRAQAPSSAPVGSTPAVDKALSDLQQRSFDSDERRRIESLEAISALPPGG